MDRIGYVRKDRYEEVLSEREDLRRRVAELEDVNKMLEADNDELKRRVEFLQIAVPAVTKIKNIGPRTATKLEEVGIKNVIDLIEASPEKIAKATGLPRERALKLRNKAMNLIKKKT